MTTQAEAAKEFRKYLKSVGIKASVCALAESGRSKVVRVAVPTFDAKFTVEEKRAICIHAIEMGMTGAVGNPITSDMVFGNQFPFYLK